MIWSGDAAHDDIIEHYRQQYRKVDEEGPISLIEYERYLQYAQESSYHEEFLLRIELDEDLPYRHDQNERWLRTECGMRPDPHIARYLEGLHIGCLLYTSHLSTRGHDVRGSWYRQWWRYS